jgi:hypothetical protein
MPGKRFSKNRQDFIRVHLRERAVEVDTLSLGRLTVELLDGLRHRRRAKDAD